MEGALKSQRQIGAEIKAVRQLSSRFVKESAQWCTVAKVSGADYLENCLYRMSIISDVQSKSVDRENGDHRTCAGSQYRSKGAR